MTNNKIYGPWIKWHGGECPVPLDTLLEAALARENLQRAWKRAKANKGAAGVDGLDIVEYCTITEQADLEYYVGHEPPPIKCTINDAARLFRSSGDWATAAAERNLHG